MLRGSSENDAIVMGERIKSMDMARIIGSWRREVNIPYLYVTGL
jgi:hypothetical protein